jgi:hypothetical protein
MIGGGLCCDRRWSLLGRWRSLLQQVVVFAVTGSGLDVVFAVILMVFAATGGGLSCNEWWSML